MTDCPDPSGCPGTVTATGTTRSAVVHTVPPDSATATKQTPDIGYTSSVGATFAAGAPHATVMAGSPYAAFCSAPAVTGRRFASRIESGRCAITLRHTAAASSESGRSGMVTGPLAWAPGAAGAGAALPKAPNHHRLKPPIARAIGTAIKAAVRAALR